MSDSNAHTDFTKHPYFDLMVPTDQLLLSRVGLLVQERNTCHEWPLSCVERIVFAGGITKYCKSMRSPSMEVEVYTNLTSPVLVPHLVVSKNGPYSTLLLDAFPGQRLSREHLHERGLSELIESLRAHITSPPGKLPIFVDLSSASQVQEHLDVMLTSLHRRFGAETATSIDPSLLRVAQECAHSEPIRDAFIQGIVYSNGDLSADNIVVAGREILVIDWQFPRLASLNVELVNLYTSLGIDPLSRLSKAEVAAGLLCKVRWFAECADRWLTHCQYQDQITELLKQLKDLGTFN